MRIFGVSVLCAYILTQAYVDCNDVTIRCPLRIEPTCVSNHLAALLVIEEHAHYMNMCAIEIFTHKLSRH